MQKEKFIAWLKQFSHPVGHTIAACDLPLLGRTLTLNSNGKEISVNAGFYGGKKVTKDELIFHLKRGDFLNLIGQEVVTTAEEIGAAHKESKVFLSSENDEEVPHVQVYKMKI
ncbi:MAG: DUF424 family protein [Candidatus Korarchaeota archaeon]|nr:DUF424 family protein [Candidatus Korarchaeota archaeon]NIU82704.1 DUF424 family protein [Candidatus Thorarchaeota archaeon]NIW13195.1 DUF424 family protein [Candidatus Thorarchaeota archaeon]NIW51334.1 DUF424 family protein [Candidatus Korarchaeota archaeon]